MREEMEFLSLSTKNLIQPLLRRHEDRRRRRRSAAGPAFQIYNRGRRERAMSENASRPNKKQ
jgi:hypothetical protein